LVRACINVAVSHLFVNTNSEDFSASKALVLSDETEEDTSWQDDTTTGRTHAL
jgi:hypothetical protein